MAINGKYRQLVNRPREVVMSDDHYIIHQFPYNDDNYGMLIHNNLNGETLAIDAGAADAYIKALDMRGWKLSTILLTHHHWDHTDGLIELKNHFGCTVYGPDSGDKTPDGVDNFLTDGDTVQLIDLKINVLATPGHTLDMLNFYIPALNLVHTADTLFALGCGRVFEGDMAMMWSSLQKLMALPSTLDIYCSHEYTEANGRFALTIDPQNPALRRRMEIINDRRSKDMPTVPTTMEMELATNPFLRPADPAIRANLGMQNASDAEVFAEIRHRKDNA